MISFVDIARRFVLRTDSLPGFRGLYHRGYEFGLSFATRRLQSLPGVLGVLLRVGEDGRTWVPGLSDYDLTVLTEPLDAADMILCLQALWKRYQRIKMAVPQLGETEVMDIGEYADFLTFGPTPLLSIKHADPLFVSPARADLLRALQRKSRVPRKQEFLLDALSRYIWFFFPAWLHLARGTSHSAQRRAEHTLHNIVKRLGHVDIALGTTPSSFTERAMQVFGDLSRACSKIKPAVEDVAAMVCPGQWKGVEGAIPLIKGFCSEVVKETKVRHCSIILWISYMSDDKLGLVFVVPDEIPGQELARLVKALGTLRAKTEGLWQSYFSNGELQCYFPSLSWPVVVSRSMWKCWCELSPFDGAAVAANGRVLMGSDDTWPVVPTRAALKRGAEVQYAALLPLKNNWRPLEGVGTPRLYAAMMNYIKGYTSATTGKVLTSPVRHDFQSTLEGYRVVCEELQVLRKGLTG